MTKWSLIKEEKHKWYIIQYFINLKTKEKMVKTIRYVSGIGLAINVFKKPEDIKNFESCLWDSDDKSWFMSISNRINEFLKEE